MDRKYFVYNEWGFHTEDNGYYSKCILRYATKDDEEYDGYNMIGRGGDEGVEIFITHNLEDAIMQSGYNPDFIQFELSNDDMKLKDEILSKYKWDKEKGLVKI